MSPKINGLKVSGSCKNKRCAGKCTQETQEYLGNYHHPSETRTHEDYVKTGKIAFKTSLSRGTYKNNLGDKKSYTCDNHSFKSKAELKFYQDHKNELDGFTYEFKLRFNSMDVPSYKPDWFNPDPNILGFNIVEVKNRTIFKYGNIDVSELNYTKWKLSIESGYSVLVVNYLTKKLNKVELIKLYSIDDLNKLFRK
jgi:hypothetical protein